MSADKKSIDFLHAVFDKKITVLRLLFAQSAPADAVLADFETLVHEYNDHVISILVTYFKSTTAEQRAAASVRYHDFITSHNFLARFNTTAAACRRAETDPVLLKQYDDLQCDVEIKRYDYKTCPECEEKMTVYPHQSEIRCGGCAFTVLLKGTVFDETQFYSQEGSIAKRGSYETSRHCRYHLERILAIKNPSLNPRFIALVHTWIAENNEIPGNMSCLTWRRCLKGIKETKFNEHIPFIRQYFGGDSPGRLFHSEQQQLYIDFDKAVHAFEHIKAAENNLKYYPYFILKILQKNITADQDLARLQTIVDCVHLQRENTVISNDRLWRNICQTVGWQFNKTDRNSLYST